MPAITPSTTYEENMGSCKLIIADFANTSDNGDYWTSGIKGIFKYWAIQTDSSGTQASNGMSVSLSSETFTFNLCENNSAFTLFVMAKQ